MNSASRIIDVLRHFDMSVGNQTLSSGWQSFLLMPDDHHEAIVLGSSSTLREITLLEEKLKSLGIPDKNYSSATNSIRNAFASTNAKTAWSNCRPSITQTSADLVLSWADWSMSKFYEAPIPEASIERLREHLQGLKDLLADEEGNVPFELREMVERQIKEMEQALALYRIQGRKPIYDAVNRQAASFVTTAPELIEEIESSSPVAKSLYQKSKEFVKDVGDVAAAGSKTFTFSGQAIGLATAGYTAVKAFLT